MAKASELKRAIQLANIPSTLFTCSTLITFLTWLFNSSLAKISASKRCYSKTRFWSFYCRPLEKIRWKRSVCRKNSICSSVHSVPKLTQLLLLDHSSRREADWARGRDGWVGSGLQAIIEKLDGIWGRETGNFSSSCRFPLVSTASRVSLDKKYKEKKLNRRWKEKEIYIYIYIERERESGAGYVSGWWRKVGALVIAPR